MTTDQTPATEAGRRLMASLDPFVREHWATTILAIEAEARADVTCPDCGLSARHIGQIHVIAQTAAGPGHADHIAAIRADALREAAERVRALPHANGSHMDTWWSDAFGQRETWHECTNGLDRAAVLAILDPETVT